MISGAAENVIREFSVDENEGEICRFFKVPRLDCRLNITLSRMKACFLATILPVGRNLEVNINRTIFTQ